jgi:hypothetical protein
MICDLKFHTIGATTSPLWIVTARSRGCRVAEVVVTAFALITYTHHPAELHILTQLDGAQDPSISLPVTILVL